MAGFSSVLHSLVLIGFALSSGCGSCGVGVRGGRRWPSGVGECSGCGVVLGRSRGDSAPRRHTHSGRVQRPPATYRAQGSYRVTITPPHDQQAQTHPNGHPNSPTIRHERVTRRHPPATRFSSTLRKRKIGAESARKRNQTGETTPGRTAPMNCRDQYGDCQIPMVTFTTSPLWGASTTRPSPR
jgi:hypothetical protein